MLLFLNPPAFDVWLFSVSPCLRGEILLFRSRAMTAITAIPAILGVSASPCLRGEIVFTW
jgi:hypothetical protein